MVRCWLSLPDSRVDDDGLEMILNSTTFFSLHTYSRITNGSMHDVNGLSKAIRGARNQYCLRKARVARFKPK